MTGGGRQLPSSSLPAVSSSFLIPHQMAHFPANASSNPFRRPDKKQVQLFSRGGGWNCSRSPPTAALRLQVQPPRRWVGDGPRRYLVTAMMLTRVFSSALPASLPLVILSTGAAGAGFLPQLRINLPLKKKKKKRCGFGGFWLCFFFLRRLFLKRRGFEGFGGGFLVCLLLPFFFFLKEDFKISAFTSRPDNA